MNVFKVASTIIKLLTGTNTDSQAVFAVAASAMTTAQRTALVGKLTKVRNAITRQDSNVDEALKWVDGGLEILNNVST